ncbi:helix-turn-helix domain-containing protein [Haladaptatus pallidirubidus]|uniref:Transcription regulator TrmB N-terminal domain-containing protein n=1 Tax=Haladaptatus pallidirubidus TaxID=1008152 RepID=A0AAV3UC18_9EURY|nr:helix-turn-helix domain-containing protein [Haladaptatus pallidirubidus]
MVNVRLGQRFASVATLPSPRTKLVYLYLHVVGGATVEELHEALGIQYLELYSALRVLRERDIVRNERSVYRCRAHDEETNNPIDGRFSRMQ